MPKIGNIEVPEFNNFEEVHDFVAKNQTLYIHFLQGSSKVEQNILLSVNEAENIEGREFDIFHCVECLSCLESLDDQCSKCYEDEYED